MLKTCGYLAAAVLFWIVATPEARAQDAASVVAAVEQVFEGMRTADADMVGAVFASDARFAVLDRREGPATVAARSVDGWLRSVAESAGRWNEQVYDLEVDVDGDMASVWAPYTFYLDGNISHCGINSIELLRDSQGWKITQLSDTRRREGCPDPLGGASRR
jgi:ketosteroid isomerase-like protein